MKNPLFLIGVGAAVAITAIIAEMNKFKNMLKEVTDGNEEAVEKAKAQLLEIEEQLKKGTKTIKGGEMIGTLDVVLSEEEIAKLKGRAEDLKKTLKGVGITYDPEKGFIFKPIKPDGGEGSEKSKSPFEQFTEELANFDDALQQVAVNGFKKMEDAIFNFVTTGKLAFKDLVTSIMHDLTRLIIRQSITKPLFAMFTGLWSKDGNAFASNNIVPYAKGGVVNKPTMFKYGGSNLGVMGEAGPEAILPLQRGRGGKLGVTMQGGGGGGTTNVNYTGPTLNFNGDEYVPKSAVSGIVQAAASRGAAMGETATMMSLQNNRSSRGRIGMR